jgi:hypothetical protein
MRWDYVSELRPTTGLLFIPQVTYEHGKPWWNEIDRCKLLIRPPELSGNPTSSHLVASRRNGQKKWWISSCEVFLFILPKGFVTYRKMLRHGASSFTSLRRNACCGLLSPTNPSPLPGLNPRTLDSMASMLALTPPSHYSYPYKGIHMNKLIYQSFIKPNIQFI